MLLKTSEQYYDILTHLAANSDECILSTFGVYCNIVHGLDLVDKQQKSADREFLESVANHPNMTVIIGVLGYHTAHFKKDCRHCELAYAKRVIRNEKHREIFPNIKWLFCESLHSKIFSIRKGNEYLGVVGSRNFTGSSNHELAVTVKDKDAQELYNYAHTLKDLSQSINLDSMLTKCLDELDNHDFVDFL